MSKINGKGLAVVTNAGGVGVITIDNLDQSSIKLADLKNLQPDLTKVLPEAASVHNPIDVLGDAGSQRYKAVLDILKDSSEVDAILILLTPQVATDTLEIAKAVVEVSKQTLKPIVPVFVGGHKVAESYEYFSTAGLPFFETPEAAIRSLDHLYKYTKKENTRLPKHFLELWEKPEPAKPLPKNLIDSLISAKENGQKSLDFKTTMDIAKLFDLPVPRYDFVDKKNYESVYQEFQNKTTAQSPMPVVLKVVTPGLLHKTEQKMVQVGIKSSAEVKKFVDSHPDQDIILQEQSPRGIEVFLGVQKDPQFGLTLVMGTGGIYAEVINDFTLIPIPNTIQDIRRKFMPLKAAKIIDGYRNRHYDLESLLQVAFNFSRMAIALEEYTDSIDINPYITREEGGSVVDLKIVF